MLGRIGWRLIKQPTSLMAKVLKARYFANSSFMEAQLGSNPTYVWRSILESQKLLRNGLCWKTESGSNISIWCDPWLHDHQNPYVTTEFDPAKGVFMVSDLICQGTWNRNLVESVFNNRDANLILAIYQFKE